MLGDVTELSAQVGRKVNNALTLTFKTSPDTTFATAVQAKSVGVLFGFRNGGPGRYTVTRDDGGGDLHVDCALPTTTVTAEGGATVGTIAKDDAGNGVFRSGDGSLLAIATAQPEDRHADFAWRHRLSGPEGRTLGQLTWIRSRPLTGWDVVNGLENLYVWWDHAGAPLKVPSLGAHLTLEAPVAAALGELLLAACVDVTVGCHSFTHR